LLGSLRKEKPKFIGSMTALITPFENGILDIHSFKKILNHQIDNGTDGLIPVGTTGESPTLSHDEHQKVVEVCIQESSGRVPIIAGAGSNSTKEASKLASHAGKAGADAVLVVTPYYNKPTQSGLYSHFMSVADAAKIPLIVYDIPGRSIVPVHDSTLVKLCENHELISGIKDATADISRPPRLLRLIGSGFSQLSGEDATALPYLAAGGHGCISVSSNIAPKLLAEMHDAWNNFNYNKAFEIHLKLINLHDAMFCESSPGPVKFAAEKLGLCKSEARLPIVEIEDISRARVLTALKECNLL
jgi:4-hydroxy-tetrahydrodipicolinate synthase